MSWHSSTHSYEYTLTEYLRLSGIYWCATALDLLAARERLPRDGVLAFVRSCYVPRLGGYACSPGNPPHLLYTLSGVQLLAEYGEMPDAAQADAIADYVARLQQDDGSFAGENSPSSAGCLEVDTRFSLCALACLKLLRRLHVIRLNDAVEYILRCMNFDGGFGVGPNSETHAGQIFCCVGALAIAGGW